MFAVLQQVFASVVVWEWAKAEETREETGSTRPQDPGIYTGVLEKLKYINSGSSFEKCNPLAVVPGQ